MPDRTLTDADVARYSVYAAGIKPTREGSYVRFDDYMAVRADRDALLTRLTAAEREASRGVGERFGLAVDASVAEAALLARAETAERERDEARRQLSTQVTTKLTLKEADHD